MHIWDDQFGHRSFRYKKYAYVKNRAGIHVSLYGDKLKRINKWDKEQPDLFESDVNPEIRVLVDNYTDSNEISVGHKVMIFDIEVEVINGFPDVQRAENKITSIAFNDPLTDEYFCYVLDVSNKLKLDDTRIKKNDVELIKSFTSEYDLLNAFFKKYVEIQPTILTGWNIEFFDISYLYNRATQIVSQSVANLLSIFLTSLTSCKLYLTNNSKSFSYNSLRVPVYTIFFSPISYSAIESNRYEDRSPKVNFL